ncbi:hypothetical protein [Alloalcanivorax xenomutans]|uniref:hypothetical protein n=1 Tax=Alloalcanivorax xenomutans TaxID=1094342 RepID=UPI00292FE08A|nr:hypothetical protein [Alloalcanivorax xenomutans]WOA31756.1 hypothetical protein RVY87_01490 [Alloalcanivorax xenomutans]
MQRSAFIPLLFATLGVVAAPLAMADDTSGRDYSTERRNLDSPENISKEYKKAIEDEAGSKRRAAEGVSDKAKNYGEDRSKIDKNIEERLEEGRATRDKARQEAKEMGKDMQSPDYAKDRENLDNPDQIKERLQEMKEGAIKPKE